MNREEALSILSAWVNCPVAFGGNCPDEEACPSPECWSINQVKAAVNVIREREEEKTLIRPKNRGGYTCLCGNKIYPMSKTKFCETCGQAVTFQDVQQN